MSHPARAELLSFVRNCSDDELIGEILPNMPRAMLQVLHDECAPEECDCPAVPAPCECGHTLPGVCPTCGDEPDVLPCPHFKAFYLSWPVLVLLEELLHPEPVIVPGTGSAVLRQDLRAVVLAQRCERGESLWNPEDKVYADCTGAVMDRYERIAFTLRNGHIEAGSLVVREAA